MRLTPRHRDPLQLKLKDEIVKKATAIAEEKPKKTEGEPITLEEFIYGDVTVNE